MAASVAMRNNCSDTSEFLYGMVAEEIWASWNAATAYFVYSPWLFSLLGSSMVGLTGIFPLLVIPIEEGADLKTGAGAGTLKILLSFAVGGLLGDVFLHLLPEAWENEISRRKADGGHPSMACGLWVLSGFLVFVIVEKMFAFDSDDSEDSSTDTQIVEDNSSQHAEKEMENNNCIKLVGAKNGFSKDAKSDFIRAINLMEPRLKKSPVKDEYAQLTNGYQDLQQNDFAKPVSTCTEYTNGNVRGIVRTNDVDVSTKSVPADACSNGKIQTKEKSKHVTGYLNLIANVIDNFTHGLAVGGSFLVSFRLGALTTFAILIHEIPHEVGDFAILLRSGFNRWDAARAQLLTATGGIFGAMFAVLFSGGGVERGTSWILPFTAGGFLHIGLVTILPELLKETNPMASLKQLGAFLLGVVVMAGLTILCD